MIKPAFASFSEFLVMGGDGFTVWAAWGLTVACVTALILYQNQRRKAYQAKMAALEALLASNAPENMAEK